MSLKTRFALCSLWGKPRRCPFRVLSVRCPRAGHISCSWLLIPRHLAQVAALRGVSPKPHALGCPGAEAHGAGLAGLSGCRLSFSSAGACLEEGISTGGVVQVSFLPGLSRGQFKGYFYRSGLTQLKKYWEFSRQRWSLDAPVLCIWLG